MAAAAQQGRKMMNDDGHKSSWPELVGKRAEYAADVIKKDDRPDVDDIEVVIEGGEVPPGYDCHRVVLICGHFNLRVVRTPVIG